MECLRIQIVVNPVEGETKRNLFMARKSIQEELSEGFFGEYYENRNTI